MRASGLRIAAASHYLVRTVVYLRSQLKMLGVDARGIIATVTNNHPARYRAFVHDVRGTVCGHALFHVPERACAALAVSGLPKPASVFHHIVFRAKPIFSRYLGARIFNRIFAGPVSQVMLRAKAKRLMLPVASVDRAQSHGRSLSVIILRNDITTPHMGVE